MERFMLKSKIHGAVLTGTELDYEGSIAIDKTLLEKADILPGEQVHVLNKNNGSLLRTHVIEAPLNSGTVLLNGPAARLGAVGDNVVIISYCCLDAQEIPNFQMKKIFVDENNKSKE
jgi:aspartate 1-decarboxylase